MDTRYIMKRLTALVVMIGLMLVLGTAAHAALAPAPGGFGAPAPGTQGFPTFYQDTNGVALGPCWDYNGFCSLLPPFCPPTLGLGCIGTPINLDPAVPISPTNFPIETFYFDATTVANFGANLKAKLTQVIALEGSFGTLPPVVAPGGQITFLRVNTRVVSVKGDLVPNSLYTVVEPYGTYTFNTDATGLPLKVGGAGVNRFLDGCAGAPCDFSILLPAVQTGVGPWLIDTAGFHTSAAGAAGTGPGGNGAAPAGEVYIGAGPLAATTVTGSPTGNNFVSITGPCANGGGAACLAAPVVSTFTDPFFFLSGKVVGILASPNPVVFPTLKTGATATAVVTITNPITTAAAQLGPATITGVNVADFTIPPLTDGCSNNANITAGGGTCTFTVIFSEAAPGVNGTKSAIVSFPVITPLNKPNVVINLTGAIDNIPPSLVSTQPANNAIDFPANNILTATFSEPVTNVTPSTFTLNGGSPAIDVVGDVALDTTGTIASFTPVTPAVLDKNSAYTATIVGGAAGITDIVGNPLNQTFTIKFTTTAPSNNPPNVISTTPADNSTGARVSDPITVTFDEAIQVNPASVTATTFHLDQGVTGSVTYDATTRTAKLQPSKQLDFFHKYTATVTTGVKSLGGVSMNADFNFSFLTNGAPTPPSLYLPEDSATGVALPVTFQWIKSKDIDAEAVTYHLWYCTNPGFLGCTPVDISSSTTGTTASAGPSPHNTLAGLGGYGAGMLLAGFAIVGGVRFKRKMFFFIAVLAISVMAVAACTKTNTVNTVPDPSTIMSKSVSTLNTKTTYYWKVVADDGNGALIESETRSFTTL